MNPNSEGQGSPRGASDSLRTRQDSAKPEFQSREARQLRAQLKEMIVENEKARKSNTPMIHPSRPSVQ